MGAIDCRMGWETRRWKRADQQSKEAPHQQTWQGRYFVVVCGYFAHKRK
jgi:hypothetical protein